MKLNGHKVVLWGNKLYWMVSGNGVRSMRSKGGWLLWASTSRKVIDFQQRDNPFDKSIVLNCDCGCNFATLHDTLWQSGDGSELAQKL